MITEILFVVAITLFVIVVLKPVAEWSGKKAANWLFGDVDNIDREDI